MSSTHQRPIVHSLASSFCKVFSPALVLTAVVFLAAVIAGFDAWEIAALLLGIVVVPGLIHKKSRPLFIRWGIADQWRPIVVALLSLIGAVLCYTLDLPEPVPATVFALFFGNAGLALLRIWCNVSAHVSVLTFAVLWTFVHYGDVGAWILLLSPLMLFTRVSLKEHTWVESLLGESLGIATFGWYAAAITWS